MIGSMIIVVVMVLIAIVVSVIASVRIHLVLELVSLKRQSDGNSNDEEVSVIEPLVMVEELGKGNLLIKKK